MYIKYNTKYSQKTGHITHHGSPLVFTDVCSCQSLKRWRNVFGLCMPKPDKDVLFIYKYSYLLLFYISFVYIHPDGPVCILECHSGWVSCHVFPKVVSSRFWDILASIYLQRFIHAVHVLVKKKSFTAVGLLYEMFNLLVFFYC